MHETISTIARIASATVASAATLVITPEGPVKISRLEGADSAIWWGNDHALSALVNGVGEGQALTHLSESDVNVLGIDSHGSPRFDLALFDYRTLLAAPFIDVTRYLADANHRKYPVALLAFEAVGDKENHGLGRAAARLASIGWYRNFDQAEPVPYFTHRDPQLPELIEAYEARLNDLSSRVASLQAAAIASPSRDGGELLLQARHQALVDRDATVGMLARTMNLQYELDHLRSIHEATLRKLQRARTDAEKARRSLKSIRKSRQYRIGKAVAQPVAAARSMGGSKRARTVDTSGKNSGKR